jgi:hypothetical protein
MRSSARTVESLTLMSYARLDITRNPSMLEVWLPEQCSRCVGVMRDFAL